MTTFAQVRHLMRKDIMQMRWWFLGYALLVIAATLSSLDLIAPIPGRFEVLLAPASWIVASILAALLVQADAPASSRAFWGSQPISSGALLLAKLGVVALLIVLPAAIGQIVALQHHQVIASHLVYMTFTSVWLYAGWLLIVMLLAALTARLASFIGLLVAVPATFMLAGILFVRSPWDLANVPVAASLVGALSTIGAVALLLTIFRRRESNRGWIAAGALVATLGLMAIAHPAAVAERAPMRSANVLPITLSFNDPDLSSLETQGEQLLQFHARGLQPPYRYSLFVDSATVAWDDGRIEPLQAGFVVGDMPFLFGGRTDSTFAGQVWMSAQRNARNEARTGRVQRLSITGVTESLVSRRIATTGASGRLQLRDNEVGLDGRGPRESGTGAKLTMTKVLSGRASSLDVFELRRYYSMRLVWPGRADTLDLPMGSATDEGRALVLPGAEVHVLTVRQQWQSAKAQSQLSAPIAEASLELLRWTPVARYPVTIERAVR